MWPPAERLSRRNLGGCRLLLSYSNNNAKNYDNDRKKISALKIETDGVESSTCIKDTDIKSVVFLLLGYKAEQAPMERKDAWVTLSWLRCRSDTEGVCSERPLHKVFSISSNTLLCLCCLCSFKKIFCSILKIETFLKVLQILKIGMKVKTGSSFHCVLFPGESLCSSLYSETVPSKYKECRNLTYFIQIWLIFPPWELLECFQLLLDYFHRL